MLKPPRSYHAVLLIRSFEVKAKKEKKEVKAMKEKKREERKEKKEIVSGFPFCFRSLKQKRIFPLIDVETSITKSRKVI
jgi:hypothetical protein